MSDPTPTSRAAKRAAARQRRIAKGRQRNDLFDFIVSGFTQDEVANQIGVSVATVRREVDKAIAARAAEAPGRFVILQRARLEKALRVVDCVLEDGDLKAVGPLIKLISELDRYHGLGARSAPPPAAGLPPRAALALTHEPETVAGNGA